MAKPLNGRQNPHTVGVDGALPYGQVGVMPANAVVTAFKGPHMVEGARQYFSDAPFIPPSWSDTPQCIGIRKNGEACKAKVFDIYGQFCKDHLDQAQIPE